MDAKDHRYHRRHVGAIGRASALAFAKAGWKVAICGRRADRLAAAKAEGALGTRRDRPTSPIPTPSPAFSPRSARSSAGSTWVFNNAGTDAPMSDVGDTPVETWRRNHRYEPQWGLLCRPRGLPRHARAVAAGRTDHQQRVDRRPRPALRGGGVRSVQAWRCGADQGDLSRRPPVRYRPADRSILANPMTEMIQDSWKGATAVRRQPQT